MKKTLLFVSLVFIAALVTAQGVSPYSLRKFSFGMEFNSDIWLNKPADLELKNINRGMNLYLLYHQGFGESNFGIAGGLSLATQNMYMKNSVLEINDEGVSVFRTKPTNVPYQRNKFNLNYFEVPFEFNYKTKSHLSFALGAKAGLLVSDKTKYKGKDYSEGGDPTKDIKRKVFNHDNLLDYRLGAYALIGYRWLNLTAYYGITKLFEDDLGPEMSPLTVGILVRPY